MLKEVLAAERTKDRQHLAQSLHAVKGDMDQIRTRMDSVEEGVTQQMHSTLAMLTKITNNYDDQARSLADLKLGQKGMEERIAALEKQPAGSVWVSSRQYSRYSHGRGTKARHHHGGAGTRISWQLTPCKRPGTF